MGKTYSAAKAIPNTPSHLQSSNLRIAISAAMKRHGIAKTRFGRDAVRDPRFVLDVFRYNREPRPETAARVRAYIASLDGEAAR
jgi:ABC-type oligopeptide transport system substrate-binding subunit